MAGVEKHQGLCPLHRLLVQPEPGHDRRYVIDFTKARRELNWVPLLPFEEGLGNTVDWYVTEFSDR